MRDVDCTDWQSGVNQIKGRSFHCSQNTAQFQKYMSRKVVRQNCVHHQVQHKAKHLGQEVESQFPLRQELTGNVLCCSAKQHSPCLQMTRVKRDIEIHTGMSPKLPGNSLACATTYPPSLRSRLWANNEDRAATFPYSQCNLALRHKL